MMVGGHIKKLRNIFTILSPREQGEALRMATNESIITELNKIKDIKDLTGYSMNEHILAIESTPATNKQKLIQQFLHNGRITGVELHHQRYSITAMTASLSIIFLFLSKNRKVVDMFPEYII